MKYSFWILSLLFSQVVLGQTTLSLTLTEAQQYAIAHAYDVQNQNLEVQKTEKLYLESLARGLPQVNANGSYMYNIERQAFIAELEPGKLGLLTIGSPYVFTAGLNAEQLLFDGSYIVAVMAAKVLQENSENGLEKSKIEIRDQVARAYHLVLVSRKTETIIEENLKFLTQSLNETSKLFEAGLVDEQDKDQLEILVSNALNNKVFAEKQEEIATLILKINLGVPLNTEVILTDDVETLMVLTENSTSLLSENYNVQKDIDFRGLEIQERGQTLNLKNEKWQYAPKIKAVYGLNYSANGAYLNVWQGDATEKVDVRWQNIGLSASVPIFNGGGRSARVQQARIALEQIEVSKKKMQDNLTLQYEKAKAEYEYALNTYVTQRKNSELGKKIRDRTMIKYREGLASSLELTQAENQYQEALRSAINAANSALDKKVNLEKVLGKYND